MMIHKCVWFALQQKPDLSANQIQEHFIHTGEFSCKATKQLYKH
jgi:hypothetical protein